MKKHLHRHFHRLKVPILHHVNHHRLQWAVGIASVFFFLGWVLHNEHFRKFAEFTIAPIAEAIISRKVE